MFHLTFSAIVLIVIVIGLPATLSRFGVLFRLSCGIVQHTLGGQSCHRAERGTHHQGCSDCKRHRTFAGVSIWICWARGANIRDGEHRYTLVARINHGESREGLFPIRQRHRHIAPIYQRYEPLKNLQETYVNRAHNDWVESWLRAAWLARR